MTEPTREAVTASIAWHRHEAGAWRSDGAIHELAVRHDASADMLAALLTRAEKAEAERAWRTK